jgi:hypothetical protein
MIALAEVEPSQERLSGSGTEITGDSFMVDVRPIVGDPAEGFMEVFKYAVKFSDQPVADTWHAFQTLKGKRLLGSAGCFRGVEVPEELTDELSMICRMSSCSIAICMERATPFRMRIAPKRRSRRGIRRVGVWP